MDPFYFCNGREIRDLRELAEALKDIPPEIFCRHVTAERNDFSAWIGPHDALLADLLRPVHDPFIMEQLIRARLAVHRHPRVNLDRIPAPAAKEPHFTIAQDPELAAYFRSATLTKNELYGLLGRAYEYLARRDTDTAKQIYLKLKDAYERSQLSEPDAQRLYEALQDFFYEVYLVMAEQGEQL